MVPYYMFSRPTEAESPSYFVFEELFRRMEPLACSKETLVTDFLLLVDNPNEGEGDGMRYRREIVDGLPAYSENARTVLLEVPDSFLEKTRAARSTLLGLGIELAG